MLHGRGHLHADAHHVTSLGLRTTTGEALAPLPRMELVPLESVASVRDALAVVRTSLYLLRNRLAGGGAVDPYLEKHLSRMEEGITRATSALRPEPDHR